MFLRFFVLAVLLLLFPTQNALAQNDQELTLPANSLETLKQKSGTEEIYRALEDISGSWSFIEDSFDRVGAPTIAYRQQMGHNRFLLDKASAQPDAAFAATIVHEVQEDLAVKAGYIRAVPSASAMAYSEVSVVVRTVKDGQEVHGYFLGFSPKYLAGQEPMYQFNNPTSPSKGSLAPGRYEMVAILNGDIVQRQAVSIGLKGGQEESIICLVSK